MAEIDYNAPGPSTLPTAQPATPAPAPDAAPAADTGTTELISPTDSRVYKVRQIDAKNYLKAGYVPMPANEGFNQKEIHNHFNGWTGAGESMLVSVASGVPFLNTAVSKLSTAENAKWWAENVKAAQEEHPYLDMAGRAIGTTAGVVGALAGGEAIAGAAGLAEAGGTVAGLSGAAAGEGGAALEGGELAAHVVKGLTGGAESGTAMGIAKIAAKGAALNAGLGQVARIDDASIQHAFDPAGQEKLSFSLEGLALDAALGGALPLAGAGLAKGLKNLGKYLDSKGLDMLRKGMGDAMKVDSLMKDGRGAEWNDAVTELIEKKFTPKQAKEYAKQQFGEYGKQMEDVKSQIGVQTALDPATQQDMMYRLKKMTGPPWHLFDRVNPHFKSEPMTIDNLQDLRQAYYDQIDFTNTPLAAERNNAAKAGASAVTDSIKSILRNADGSLGQGYAQRWADLDAQYSRWKMVHNAIRKTNVNGGESFGNVLRSIAGKMGAGYFIGGFVPGAGGAIGGGLTGGVWEANNRITAEHVANGARILGKFFSASDRKLSNAVEAGLYGMPAQIHNIYSKQPYDVVASKIAAVKANPQTALANMQAGLAKAGIPDALANDMALRQHTGQQWLGDQQPKRADAGDIVTKSQGDPVQQHRWLGQARTMADPTFGLLYPTSSNLDVLKKFYPQTLYAAQQAIYSQVARNPNLPQASKQYASRVLGRPVTNLSSPIFSQMLQQAREASAQKDQAQAHGNAGKKAVSSDSGSATRLDELQGGG